MKVNTNRMNMARQMAGDVPDGAKIIGLITESDDCYCRNYAALVRMSNGIYVTMMGNVIRSIDQNIAKKAVENIKK